MILHAGDSRAYRLRGDSMKRLSRDHSLAAEAGVEDETRLGPMFQSMVTRAVGVQLTVEMEETDVDVRSGDLFLLCSDGLTRMLPDNVLSVLLAENRNLPLDGLAQLLVDEANDNGGLDNVTVLLIRAGDIPEKPAAALDTPQPARTDKAEPTEEPVRGEARRRDTARTDEPGIPSEPDSSEPLEDSSDRELPSDDLEGNTPSELDSPIPREGGKPTPDATPESSSTPTTPLAFVEPPAPVEPSVRTEPPVSPGPSAPAPAKPAVWTAWIIAAAICAVLVAGTLMVMHRAKRSPNRVSPPEPALLEPVVEDSQPVVQPRPEPRPAVPAPAPLTARPPVAKAPSQPLAARDIATMRATLPTKIDGTLLTGEWGDMQAHVLKWSPVIDGYLAQSGKEALYSRWLAQWKKVEGGQLDPASHCAEYRAAVVTTCASAGSEAPPEEIVSWNTTPSAKADACCRLLYLMQRQLTAGVERFAADSAAEADVPGDAPSDTLDALSRFVGKTDDELVQCKAGVKTIRGDIERLETWLTACGDSPIPLDSIRMVPGTAVPRIKTALQMQRTALSNRLSLVPAAVNSRRWKRDLSAADLNAIRGMYARLAEQGLAGPAFWKKNSNRNDVKMLLARIRTVMNQAAPRPNGQ
jgi:hypothetical protein